MKMPMMIPLLVTEGLGVVDQHADAATHHPLPLLPLRRGVICMAEDRRQEQLFCFGFPL
jgi:hypothetical protein